MTDAGDAVDEWNQAATALGLPPFHELDGAAQAAIRSLHIDEPTLAALGRYAAQRHAAAAAGHLLPPPNRSTR